MTLDAMGVELEDAPLKNGADELNPAVRLTPIASTRHCACGRKLHDNMRKRCRQCQAAFVRNMGHKYKHRA